VQLKPPKPATTEPPKQAPVQKPVSAPKSVPVPKPAKVQKSPSKPAPKVSPQDGPDPRFKEGELFASKRSFVGFPVSPLFSGGARGTLSRKRVFSSPDNESWGLFDSGIDAKLGIFCQSLQARLSVALGFQVSVSWGKEFLRMNANVYYWVDVSTGDHEYRVVRLVGAKTDLDFQVSLFGVKLAGLVRSEFLNNALVSRVVAHFTSGGVK
jgi:hypothetical protein